MTEEQVEKILMEYKDLEKLIEALEQSAEKMTLRDIALSLGPSESTTQDVTRLRAQTTHQDWLYNFGRACDKLIKHQEKMAEEYERYITRRAEIWDMIYNTELENREKEYAVLRYIQGLSIREIRGYDRMGLSKTALQEIRSSTLKKIARGIK